MTDIEKRVLDCTFEFERKTAMHPTTLYLGYVEYNELREAMFRMALFTTGYPLGKRATYYGMPIFKVDDRNHLGCS